MTLSEAQTQSSEITVEVAYAKPEQQIIIPLKVKQGCTATQAVAASGILDQFPELDAEKLDLGIFGKVTRPDTELHHLDRVEIYRPLIADPKEVRRQRAEAGKRMKKGGGDATA